MCEVDYLSLLPGWPQSTNTVDPCIARVAVARSQCVHQSTLADFPVLIWLDERIGELAPINVQFALSGSGIHGRGTPG
jgi:hypothetical protein